jgi:hypothetical protein
VAGPGHDPQQDAAAAALSPGSDGSLGALSLSSLSSGGMEQLRQLNSQLRADGDSSAAGADSAVLAQLTQLLAGELATTQQQVRRGRQAASSALKASRAATPVLHQQRTADVGAGAAAAQTGAGGDRAAAGPSDEPPPRSPSALHDRQAEELLSDLLQLLQTMPSDFQQQAEVGVGRALQQCCQF